MVPAEAYMSSSAQASAQGLVHHRHLSAPVVDNHFVPRRRILCPFQKLCLSSRLPITLRRSLIAPMVGFSEGSLVANLKNWARRSPRKEQIAANQSRRTSSQHSTTTDEAEQSQSTSSVAQHLAITVEVEQSQRTSTVSQHLATNAEAEQSQRTSFVAQHPAITSD